MKRGVDISARHDHDRSFEGLDLAGKERSERDRTSRLDDEAVTVPGESDRLFDFRIAYGHRGGAAIAAVTLRRVRDQPPRCTVTGMMPTKDRSASLTAAHAAGDRSATLWSLVPQ